MDRGSSRRCPGVVTGHIIPLEASVNELLRDGDLGHPGEVSKPGIAASAARAAIGCLVLEAPVLLVLRLGDLEPKLARGKLLCIGITLRAGPPGAGGIHAA